MSEHTSFTLELDAVNDEDTFVLQAKDRRSETRQMDDGSDDGHDADDMSANEGWPL